LQQIRLKLKIKTLLTTLFILASLGLSAQNNIEGEAFQLTKQGAHYVFTASINGIAKATILELREATTPSGEVVGQFILTKQCQLCGIAFPDAVVVITQNLPLFTTPGDIGLKFFERTHAIFDFDHSFVFMKGE
jgi:hypothetical protein